MIDLNKLLAKRAQYEQEKIYIDAKIAVVDEWIEEEKAQCAEQHYESNADEGVIQENFVDGE